VKLAVSQNSFVKQEKRPRAKGILENIPKIRMFGLRRKSFSNDCRKKKTTEPFLPS
jgi:hypothetical protein